MTTNVEQALSILRNHKVASCWERYPYPNDDDMVRGSILGRGSFASLHWNTMRAR